MIDLEKLLSKLESKKIEKELLKKQLIKITEDLKESSNKFEQLEKLKMVILTLSIESKNEMIEYVEDLVSTCLSSIFDSKYTFEIKLNDRYDQQECHFFLNKNGLLLETREDMCGDSVLSICSLGLRASTLIIDAESEPVFLMDEPFKDLRYDKKPYVRDLIEHLSKDLDIQFNIVTHDPEYIKLADNLIDVGD